MNIHKRRESILKLDSNKRYEFSISSIAESEEAFFISNQGLIILSDSDENKFIPIWPEKEFAEAYKDQDSNETIVKVTLEDLIFEIVPDLLNQDIKLAVFPVLSSTETKIALKDFIYDLNQYLIEFLDDGYEIPYLKT